MRPCLLPRLFSWLAICLTLGAVPSLIAQPGSGNIPLLGHLPYPQELSDVWGYTDSAGREYALVGVFDGVSIVSLEDPAQPQQLFFLPHLPTIWRDLKTWQHYAYVSNEAGDGIRIIDLSGLPDTVVYKDSAIAGVQTVHNLWIDEFGYLYLLGAQPTSNVGTVILDLSADPWRPSLAGIYPPNGFGAVHDLYVRGGVGYSAELNEGLLLVDFSDPAQWNILAQENYTGAFTHNTWLNDAGTVCFTTDEYSGTYIQAWDIRDPQNIRLLGRYRSPHSGGTTIPHNVHVRNDYLIISYYRDGVVVVDASRPRAMTEIGYYDTSPLSGNGFNGCWGAFPFFSSGIALGSDIENGLFVLQPDYRRALYIEGIVSDAQTGLPIAGALLSLSDGRSLSTFEEGDYAFGFRASDTVSLSVSALGYLPDTIEVALGDSSLTRNLALTPLPRTDLLIRLRDSLSGQPLADVILRVEAQSSPLALDGYSNASGEWAAAYVVVDSFEVFAGKWGYRNRALHFRPAQGADTLEIALLPGYLDDFALDQGWQVQGNARDGGWERGIPQGTFYDGLPSNPGADLPGDVGAAAWVTGNGGGGPFDDDLQQGYTLLSSPIMNLSAYREPMIRYHGWVLDLDTLGQPTPDSKLTVQLLFNQSSQDIRTYEGSALGEWKLEDSIRVSDYFAPSLPLRIRFVAQDIGNNHNLFEAALDGFEVFEGDPGPPASLDQGAAPGAFWASGIGGVLVAGLRNGSASAAGELSLTDLQGAQLLRIPTRAGESQWQLPLSLPAGLYLARYREAGQQPLWAKIQVR
jgi:choice-of-anchor B domain-containing protein